MGGRTIGIYIVTTVVAVSIGLLLVNVIKPGNSISEETRMELVQNYSGDAEKYRGEAHKQQESGPLQALVDIVPENMGKPTFALYTGTEEAEEKEIIRNVFNGTWEYVPSTIREELVKQSSNNRQ